MCVKRSLLNNTSLNVQLILLNAYFGSLESILARAFLFQFDPFVQNENPIFILYLHAKETVASNNV